MPSSGNPSEKTPLTATAVQALFERAVERFGEAPANLSVLVQGGREAGETLVDDRRVALVSATGSTRMGREVAPRVAARFGRSLLELGGNNGMVVAPSADLDLAERAITFAAVGTAGQRCTTLRRLFVMPMSMIAWCRASARSGTESRSAIRLKRACWWGR
jgi:aldehyde dehydrogenase (NAD+)